MNSACHYGEGDSLCKNSFAITAPLQPVVFILHDGDTSVVSVMLTEMTPVAVVCPDAEAMNPDRFLSECGTLIVYCHGLAGRSLSAIFLNSDQPFS